MAYSIRRKARTRQSILEAAYRLFAAKGYEGTSIDEIMGACGLTGQRTTVARIRVFCN
jgi:AcrR family transcriptional regulator